MTTLLFPGRHHLLTNFQLEYLTLACGGSPAALRDVNGKPLEMKGPIDTLIWAVTSANHANTRRNPLPAHRREAAIEEFADQLDVESFVYMIDDVGTTERFAEYILKKIDVDSQGRFRLTPNTVVGCSTPGVIELYERLGFRVLPFELSDRATRTFAHDPPWQILTNLVQVGLNGHDWKTNHLFLTQVARATRRLYLKYHYDELVVELHRRPLLTEDGDITATRDYNTYVRAFDEGAHRKYELMRDFVVSGRIVDIGCCTGSLIRELTRDDRLRESDFFGIEVARHLYAECLHRKEQGAFANENVFFYQRDFAAGPIFAGNSVNTFTTFSLTHEIESYLGRAAIERFITLLYDQLAMNGRWINVDVVGPENGSEVVYLRLNRGDGSNQLIEREFAAEDRGACQAYLNGLSTYGRFLQFAHDFRRAEGDAFEYATVEIHDVPYVKLRLADACEFLSKKDYTDNWQSEMHEKFCFWSFSDWKQAVTRAGCRVHPSSHAFVNPWIVEHRYRGKADLFQMTSTGLMPLDYPVTNMVLIAEKS